MPATGQFSGLAVPSCHPGDDHVLITQCLQRDFVHPIGPHDPLAK